MEDPIKARQEKIAELQKERAALQSVLNDQQQYFTDLITRVTNLRVAKGEYMAAQSLGVVKELKFNTGNAVTDDILRFIQNQTRDTGVKKPSLLDLLLEAAREGVVPQAGDVRLSSAARLTALAMVTRPDVRGVRQWATRHAKECPKCAASFQKVPPTEPYHYFSKATGLAASPDLTKVEGKNFHRVTARIIKERCLADRMEERHIELLRCVFGLKVLTSAGQPLSDPNATAAELTNLINKWTQKSLKAVQENVRTKAAWNLPGTENAELSAAVDMLLYSIVPTVAVKATGSSEGSTVFTVQVHISSPLQISVVEPLVMKLNESQHRDYIAQYLWEPMASWIGDALGVGDVLRRNTSVGMKFIDSLYALYHKMAAEKKGATPTMEKLFELARALATYGTTVAVDVAVPSVVEELQSLGAAKRSAIRLGKALLRNVTSPSPLVLPPRTDPEAVDVNVRLLRVPTGILEVLNNKYSSNQRLPSTSRASVLDLVVTPKTKLSVALKLYSELLIEIYRPYSPSCGVAVAGSGGTTPPCMPVIDLPVDTIRSNVELNQMTSEYREKLEEAEGKEFTLDKNETLEKGKEKAKDLLQKAEQSITWAELKTEIESLQLKVCGVQGVQVEVALPFGLSVMQAVDTTRPILYGQIKVI